MRALTLGYMYGAKASLQWFSRQRALIASWCRQNHRPLTQAAYLDETAARPLLAQTLADIQGHAGAVLVVPALSQLTDDVGELIDVIERVFSRPLGPWLVALSDGFDGRRKLDHTLIKVMRCIEDFVDAESYQRDGVTFH